MSYFGDCESLENELFWRPRFGLIRNSVACMAFFIFCIDFFHRND